MRLTTQLTVSAVLALSTLSAAVAMPVTGSIAIYGYVAPTSAVSFGATTGLNFVDRNGKNNGSSPGEIASYGSGTGSFSNMSCATGICGTIKDIADVSNAGSIAQFLTLSNGISFDLTSVSKVSRDMAGGSIVIEALGNISVANYSLTAGKFRLVASGNSITAFSAEAGALDATFVPEPMSMTLLGGGLVAVGLVRRRSARPSP